MNIDVNDLIKQVNTNLKSEILYYELQNILKEKKILTKFVGVSKRNNSKDLKDISTLLFQEKDETGFINEAIVLHLSKNSIYHCLPELLFHPLSISNPTMSNKEIVEAVKKNKALEEETLTFFMPFDNELFNLSVNLSNRALHLFNDNSQLFYAILDDILAIDYELDNHQKQNLFLYLCEVERLKENLSELEGVLKMLLNIPVKLNYKKHIISKKHTAFKDLSEGVLGYDFGLSGDVESELDDVEATLYFDGSIDYLELMKKMDLTQKILQYFIIPGRKVNILFFNNYQLGITVNENYLGINTIL